MCVNDHVYLWGGFTIKLILQIIKTFKIIFTALNMIMMKILQYWYLDVNLLDLTTMTVII